MDFLKRTWALIDLDKVTENFEKIKQMANERYVMPIIKCDAYGHGANTLASLYEENGAKMFAVSNLQEAIKLRKHGIKKDLLILGFTPTDCVKQLHDYNITQAVFCLDYAKSLSAKAEENGLIIKTHLKIDTGMCRIGYNCRNNNDILNSLDEIIECLSLKNLDFEGIFTHYSSADSFCDEDVAFSDKQYEMFNKTISLLRDRGFDFKYVHCCNSAATATRDESEGNLVRPGIILYGLSPAYNFDVGYKLSPALSIKSTVAMIKTLNKDEAISYGRTYVTDKPITVATIPIGYGDGYPRKLSNIGKVIINGKFASVVGRVCMDQIVVDVTGIDGVDIGSVVTVIGQDGGLSITADDIANVCNTISYEIVCNISARVPRVYIKNNKITEVVYLGGEI